MFLIPRIYKDWKTDIDNIYDDCRNYAEVTGFNYENYTRTIEVFEFICNSRPGKLPTYLGLYSSHKAWEKNSDDRLRESM